MLVWSACIASCSVPEVFGFQDLYMKTEKGNIVPYFAEELEDDFAVTDGSMSCDLPMEEVSRLFGASSFIVSQVNPQSAPFIWDINDRDNTNMFQKMMRALKMLIFNNVSHVIQQFHLLGLAPRDLHLMADLSRQANNGSVTISPSVTIQDYLNLFKNLNKAEFEQCQ